MLLAVKKATATTFALPREPGAGLLKLLVVSGPDFGKALVLHDGVYRVGTSAGLDLMLTDPAVSREHLHLQVQREGVRLEDRGSRNGSFHGGVRFEAIEVRTGAIIRIGRTELQIAPADAPLPMRPSDSTSFGGLCGESLGMRLAFATLERAAEAGTDVLLQGETGTGKDLAAEGLHARGDRAKQPFVICDLAAVPASLMESELFGHVRGAYTGAVSDRAGAFERAHRGTIFLDEIGDLPLEMQPRLLRALERRQIKRVGGDRYETFDVRVIAATHKDLKSEVGQARFREDLYHRLSMVTVTLPPLRDRLDDLPVLVDAVLRRLGVPVRPESLLTPATQQLFRVHDWRGNVRELRNVIERAVKLGVEPELPSVTRRPDQKVEEGPADVPFKEAKERLVNAFERDYLADLMQRCDQNVSLAAREAGIARVYLHRLLQKHGLTRK
jgi:DNA-binding NtrC family response regulator